MKIQVLKKLIIYVVFVFSLVSVIAQNTELPVGTVLYSILPPEAFLQENGKDNWMLLGGQPIKETDSLYKTLEKYHLQGILGEENRLPDARGKFVRSMNHQGGDDEPNRVVGSPQGDLTRMPDSAFRSQNVFNNVNTIEYSAFVNKPSIARDEEKNPNLYLKKGPGLTNGKVLVAQFKSPQEASVHPSRIQAYIDRRHSILGISTLNARTTPNVEIHGGDAETRPKNIALYTYIKIN